MHFPLQHGELIFKAFTPTKSWPITRCLCDKYTRKTYMCMCRYTQKVETPASPSPSHIYRGVEYYNHIRPPSQRDRYLVNTTHPHVISSVTLLLPPYIIIPTILIKLCRKVDNSRNSHRSISLQQWMN